MARNLKPNVIFDCAQCGTHVERYISPSEITKGKAKALYCSRTCARRALSGERHHAWAGGRYVNEQGYVLVHSPDHPNADARGYVREHRLVMEAAIGRLLRDGEVVHHINGTRADNRLANLRLYASNAEHKADDSKLRQRDDAGRFLPLEAAA